MPLRMNVFTGTLDIVGTGEASFDVDTILTGPDSGGDLQVLIDSDGNVLTES